MTGYRWNPDKNILLQKDRGISFEQIVFHIDNGDLLDITPHPNKIKYPTQRVFIVKIHDYVYAVPFVMEGRNYFLKTAFPSRMLRFQYLGGQNEKDSSR